MKRIYHTGPVANEPEHEARVRSASWDDDSVAIKYAVPDRNGHIRGTGEVSTSELPFMLAVAIRSGYLALADA
jgi:hypothetical protein